jgi:hypothetical protein
MLKQTVWVAEMHTRKFDFIAVGRTADEAEKALAKRWNKHAKAYDLDRWGHSTQSIDPGTVGEYYGMWVRPMNFGEGYMDGESAE